MLPLHDVSSGELRSATAMDREKTPTYKLIAQATDGGGLFCRSDISLKVLDVNDNAPSFSSSHYLASVYENATPNTLLTRLQASDPDEGELAWCAECVTGQAEHLHEQDYEPLLCCVCITSIMWKYLFMV